MIILNLRGQYVCTLVNEVRSPGVYEEQWNGLDDAGNHVSTGIYLVRFRSGSFTATKKLIMMK